MEAASGGRLVRAMRVAIGSLLIIPAAYLLIFGPRSTESAPNDRTVIDYWEKWTSNEELAIRQIVDDFNNTVGREKHIYVRFLSTSLIEQKVLVSTAAGVPPDVAGVYDQDIPQFGALDALLPLDDYAAKNGITASQYKPPFWDAGHFNGHLYGLVSTGYDIALYYNKTIFHRSAAKLRAAGLDPDRGPRTIKELDAYAAALDVRDDKGRLLVAGFLPHEPGWFLIHACYWFGGSWWDRKDNRFTFLSPPVVDTYRWVEGYSKRLGAQNVADFRAGLGNFDSPQNAFVCGTVAMEMTGTFFANFIHHLNPSLDGQWAVVPFPSNVPGQTDVTYCASDLLVIPRGSKHPDEAFEFIKFVQTQKEIEKLATLHWKISALSKVSPSFLDNNPNPYIRVFDRLAAGPNAHDRPPVPILQQVIDEMTAFTQQLALLQTTPEQGLRQVQDRLQQSYDDFMEQQRRRHAKEAAALQ